MWGNIRSGALKPFGAWVTNLRLKVNDENIMVSRLFGSLKIPMGEVIEARIKGVTGEMSWERTYPYGDSLKSILGTIGRIPY